LTGNLIKSIKEEKRKLCCSSKECTHLQVPDWKVKNFVFSPCMIAFILRIEVIPKGGIYPTKKKTPQHFTSKAMFNVKLRSVVEGKMSYNTTLSSCFPQ